MDVFFDSELIARPDQTNRPLKGPAVALKSDHQLDLICLASLPCQMNDTASRVDWGTEVSRLDGFVEKAKCVKNIALSRPIDSDEQCEVRQVYHRVPKATVISYC